MFKAQAVILAGGKGSRLRPYTNVLPKPLMPLGDLPIVEIIIRQLKHYGFKRIVISVGHLAGLIESFLGDGKRWGVEIRYVRENVALGTAGALKLVKQLEDDFLVMNGDVLTDMDFKELLKAHKKKKAIATIAVKERKVKSDFGVIVMNQADELLNYDEKPEHVTFVSMGINVLNKKSRALIGQDEMIGMPDLMLRIKDKYKKVNCYKTKSLWLDLGRFGDFERAQEVFQKQKKKFLYS